MAQSAYLKLTIDGNRIDGESKIQTMDRDNTIECYRYEHHVSNEATKGTEHSYATIVKPVDRSSPLLFKALDKKEAVTEAEFMFFRPEPGGGGAEQQYLTVLLETGRIVRIEHINEPSPSQSDLPMLETVSFSYQFITQKYGDGGLEYRTEDLAIVDTRRVVRPPGI